MTHKIAEIACRLAELHKTDKIVYPALVFVRKRSDTKVLTETLQAAGCRADWCHGQRSHDARENLLTGLRGGDIDIVVCTDVWQRGINIPDLRTVILTGGLSKIALVQRIGRGSRLAPGKTKFDVIDLGPLRTFHVRAEIYNELGLKARSGWAQDETEIDLFNARESKESRGSVPVVVTVRKEGQDTTVAKAGAEAEAEGTEKKTRNRSAYIRNEIFSVLYLLACLAILAGGLYIMHAEFERKEATKHERYTNKR